MWKVEFEGDKWGFVVSCSPNTTSIFPSLVRPNECLSSFLPTRMREERSNQGQNLRSLARDFRKKGRRTLFAVCVQKEEKRRERQAAVFAHNLRWRSVIFIEFLELSLALRAGRNFSQPHTNHYSLTCTQINFEWARCTGPEKVGMHNIAKQDLGRARQTKQEQ